MDGDGPHHHEGQRRIPAPENVEEPQHLVWVGHARQAEPRREQQPAPERRSLAPSHGLPANARTSATTSAPVAVKTIVATIARFERRLTPQIPCPLVQPPPSRVPKPTATPASAKSGRAAGLAACAAGRI